MDAPRAPLAAALALVALLAGCAAPEPGPGGGTGGTGGPPAVADGSFHDGFEAGLGQWAQGSDVPDDPNRPGEKVAWNITESDDRAAAGNRSARFALDGRQDDGTIWLHRPVRVEPGRAYHANLSVAAWSPSESFNTRAYLVLFMGPHAPSAEADFTGGGEGKDGQPPSPAVAGRTAQRREPLDQAAGWRNYTLTWTTPPFEGASLWVAAGISVVFETEVAFWLDEVDLRLAPADAAP